jgi:heme/copper-type cytochrome/quinol oxidase subunit 1
VLTQLLQGLGGTPLFFWETLATFVFVYIAYPALFARPSYGSFGPLYVGLALFAVLATGKCWGAAMSC